MYILEEDTLFKKVISNDLAPTTKRNKINYTKKFCSFMGETFEKIVLNMKKEEYGELIDGYKIIPYNVENSYTKDCLDGFKNYLESQELKESTIKIIINTVRTVLKEFNIILPKPPKFKKNNESSLNLLTQEDISYVLSQSNIHTQAFIVFAATTGLRLSDICNLTIKDYLYAVKKYHNCSSVDEFVNTAPLNMIGYWELYPQKTKKHGVIARVCNTPESNNLLLKSLKLRIECINELNQKYGKNESLTLDDNLFASREKYYKKSPIKGNFSVILYQKNKILQNKLRKDLKTKLDKKELSIVEYYKKLDELPKIHPHALRHYFISVLNAYCNNKTIALKMEGHAGNISIHKHYIGKSEDLYGEKMIREHYNSLIPYLSFLGN